MPISRFLEFLLRTANYERYMEKLVDRLQSRRVGGLMCRTTLSVGWDGTLYDCDFNQMLDCRWITERRGTFAISTERGLGRAPHRHRRALFRLHRS